MEMKIIALLILGILAVTDADDSNKITITTIVEAPYVIIKDNTILGIEKFTGFIPDLLKLIADKIQLHYEIKVVKDGKYGKLHNNKWNGMIGEIDRREADVAAAPMTISPEREGVVNFTKPFMSFHTTALMKKPKEGETINIKHIQDLADQTEIKYGCVDDGMTEQFFRDTKDAKLKKMWETMEGDHNSMMATNKEGVDKVRDSDGKYAFIMESPTADYYINQKPCDLTKRGQLYTNTYGFAVGREKGLLQKLNEAIEVLRADGELGKLQKQWWKGECSTDNDSSSSIRIGVTSSLLFTLAVFRMMIVHL